MYHGYLGRTAPQNPFEHPSLLAFAEPCFDFKMLPASAAASAGADIDVFSSVAGSARVRSSDASAASAADSLYSQYPQTVW